MTPRRILILYYSQTGQTKMVLEVVRDELVKAQHRVDMVRLEPLEDFRFPWSPLALLGLCLKTYAGANLSVALKDLPQDVVREPYDLVLVGYQPWFLTPSVPVRSFLDCAMSELLRGRNVVSVITARALWRRSYRVFAAKVASRGGRVVDSLVVQDPSRQPMNMVTTVFYLLTGRTLDRGFFKRVFPPVGIGEGGLQQSRIFGEKLSARLATGEI
jgi:hypothetical protein